jgi:hypothetical protein
VRFRRVALLAVVLVVLVACSAPDASRAPLDAAGVSDAAEGGRNADVGPGIDVGASPDASAVPDSGADAAAMPDVGASDTGSGDASAPTTDRWPGTDALLRPANPMPCADPAVVSERNEGRVYYVFCTGMAHLWTTSDWVAFRDVSGSTTFDLAGMSTEGRRMGAWWAPGVIYAPALSRYVMWVSVPDAGATDGTDGWSARSLAVLTAPAPDGPWTFRAIAIDAGAGEHFIDPFLFLDADGLRYVYWKQYGGAVTSSIMGARVDAAWTGLVAGTRMEVMNGYGGTGTWEDNVRENPAVWRDASGGHHMLFSGGHWRDDTYATGHAISTCGPLCPSTTTGGWHMRDSGDRGILQVVRAFGQPDFASGGPGGAVFMNDAADDIVYAAAARSRTGTTTRYLMRDHVQWANRSPFVDRAGHQPVGY